MNPEFLFLAVVFFVAGIVPELIGFGVASILMATIPFVIPVPVAIPLVAIMSTIATGIVALQTKTRETIEHVAPLLIGSILGVVLGMFFLEAIINGHVVRMFLAIFLMSYSLFGMLLKHHIWPTGKIAGAFTGLAGGFFGASFNIHGPLVGLYSSSNGKLSKAQTKNLIATYMFFTGLFTVVGHTASNRITNDVLMYGLLGLPFILLGLAVGNKIFGRISAVWIKRGIYFVVFFASVTLLLL